MTSINTSIGGGIPDPFQQLDSATKTTTSTKTANIDTQNKYESGDSVGQSILKPPIDKTPDYTARAQLPELAKPRDNVSNQEYSKYQQLTIKNEFYSLTQVDLGQAKAEGTLTKAELQQVKSALQALVYPTGDSDPRLILPTNLAKIVNQIQQNAAAQIKEKYGLGDQWSASSNSPDAWSYSFGNESKSVSQLVTKRAAEKIGQNIKESVNNFLSGTKNESTPVSVSQQNAMMKDYSTIIDQASQLVLAMNSTNLSPIDLQNLETVLMNQKMLSQPNIPALEDWQITNMQTTINVLTSSSGPVADAFQKIMASSDISMQLKYDLPTNWQGGNIIMDIQNRYQESLTNLVQAQVGDSSFPPQLKEPLLNALATGVASSSVSLMFEELKLSAADQIVTRFPQATTGINAAGTEITDVNKEVAAKALVSTSETWSTNQSGPVNLASANQALFTQLGTNSEKILTSLDSIGTKMLSRMDRNDPNRIVLADFLKAISSAIGELKAALREMVNQDSKKLSENSQAKQDVVENRQNIRNAIGKVNNEVTGKQKAMSDLVLAFKILGPIVTAIIAVISVVVTICTFGAATPLAVAAIGAAVALTAAVIAYSIADSIVGVTSMAVDLFNKTVEGFFPNGPKWAQDLVKAVIVIAAVAVIIVAVVAVAAAATSAATSLASQAIMEGIKAVIKMFVEAAINAAITILFSSNVVPNLVGTLADLLGADPQMKMIAQVMAMVAQTAALLMAMAATKGKSLGTGIKSSIQTFGKGVVEAGKGAISTGKDMLAASKSFVQAFSPQSIKTTLGNVSATVTRAIEFANRVAGQTAAQNMEQFGAALMKVIKSLLTAIAKTTRTDIAATAGNIKLLATAGQYGSQIVEGIVSGVIHLQLAKLLKAKGDLEATEALLQELIKMLTKLMDSIQGSITGVMDFISGTLDEFMKRFMGGLNNSVDQMFRG